MNSDQIKDVPNYNVDDFLQRWQKARISAIRKASGNDSDFNFSEQSIEAESILLDQYFSQGLDADLTAIGIKKDLLLKYIFDNSRYLAMGFSKFMKLSFELQDFQELLSRSQIPCVQGEWEVRDKARILTRGGCGFCPQAGANACDYWREALDGLIMGLGERERLARHASVRHGDAACVDVFYFDSEGKKETSLAWGPLPEHMAPELKLICDDFENKMKTSILLKGLSEGVLYFEFKSATDTLCNGGQLLTSTFLRKIQKKYPGLLIQEVTPRAVIGAGV